MYYNREGAPRLRLAELLRSDIVYIYRCIDDEALAIARRCREEGVAVVWDNDDDLTALPKTHPRYRLYGGVKSRAILLSTTRMVRLADIVTTPSPRLADKFRELGASHVRVVENFLPGEFRRTQPRQHDGIVIGWTAGLEHQLDYQALRLRETLERLLGAYGQVRVRSVGLGLGLPSSRYDHLPGVPFLDLARTAAGYDIGIAPLADVPFNHARSNVKLKEYAAAGVPWLASPVGAYATMGQGQGGRLVAERDWYDALQRLILGASERRKLAKRATKWGSKQYIDQNVGLWEAVFDDAARARRENRLNGS
jgi:glycosyltransferase involved in cell wall biosynthesis